MPNTVSAALRRVKAASDAAGASVMGPALRERVKDYIHSGVTDDSLWERIQNSKDTEELTQLILDSVSQFASTRQATYLESALKRSAVRQSVGY